MRRWLLASGLSLVGCSPARLAGVLTRRGGAEERPGLAYGPQPWQRLDLTLPPGADATTPLVVFFYGGGWTSGARADYAFLARALAREGFAVAIPDYRLWPAGRWPDFVQDGAAAIAWLRGAAGVPHGPLFVMGHSAGGFIAASLALDPRWLGRGTLAGGVLLAAPIAWQPTEEPTVSIFAAAPGGRIEAVPDPSALREAPPMLMVHGTADTVVGPFHSERLARALAAAGRPAELLLLPGAGHVEALSALAEPVRRYLGGDPGTWERVVAFLREGAARG